MKSLKKYVSVLTITLIVLGYFGCQNEPVDLPNNTELSQKEIDEQISEIKKTREFVAIYNVNVTIGNFRSITGLSIEQLKEFAFNEGGNLKYGKKIERSGINPAKVWYKMNTLNHLSNSLSEKFPDLGKSEKLRERLHDEVLRYSNELSRKYPVSANPKNGGPNKEASRSGTRICEDDYDCEFGFVCVYDLDEDEEFGWCLEFDNQLDNVTVIAPAKTPDVNYYYSPRSLDNGSYLDGLLLFQFPDDMNSGANYTGYYIAPPIYYFTPVTLGILNLMSDEDIEALITSSIADVLHLSPTEEDSLEDVEYEDRVEIYLYLYHNVVDDQIAPEAEAFAKLAIEALDNDGVDDGEVDFEENIIYEKSINDYPCHKMVISEATGTCSSLTQLVLDAFEANEGVNLIFKASSTISGNGSTSSTSSYNPETHTCDITITFRKSYLETATDLSIARTAIHESLHAVLVYMSEENLLESPDGTPLEGFEDFVEAYIDYLSGQPANLGVAHHTLMSDLVEDIATSLSTYAQQNGHTNPFSFYKNLSWGGLTHSKDDNGNLVENDFFIKAVPSSSDRMTIVNTYLAEQNNVNNLVDGNGNNISPKGTPPNAGEPCN